MREHLNLYVSSALITESPAYIISQKKICSSGVYDRLFLPVPADRLFYLQYLFPSPHPGKEHNAAEIFLLIPFFKDVTFRSPKANLSKHLLILSIFIISIIHISLAGVSYSQRIGHVNNLIGKVKVFPEKKFVANENHLNPDHFRVYWGMPFETLILSSLEHPDSARTIYVLYNHETLGKEVDLNNPNLLLTIQGYPFFMYNEYLDTNYFNIGKCVYRVLEESDIVSSGDYRILVSESFQR